METAPISKRIFAFLIDTILLAVLVYVFAIAAFLFFGKLPHLSNTSYFLYFAYVIILPYYWNGQTIGKKALSIKITSLTGGKLTFKMLIIRAVSFFLFFNGLPWLMEKLLGYNMLTNILVLAYLLLYTFYATKNNFRQMFHDILAKTKVVTFKN